MSQDARHVRREGGRDDDEEAGPRAGARADAAQLGRVGPVGPVEGRPGFGRGGGGFREPREATLLPTEIGPAGRGGGVRREHRRGQSPPAEPTELGRAATRGTPGNAGRGRQPAPAGAPRNNAESRRRERRRESASSSASRQSGVGNAQPAGVAPQPIPTGPPPLATARDAIAAAIAEAIRRDPNCQVCLSPASTLQVVATDGGADYYALTVFQRCGHWVCYACRDAARAHGIDAEFLMERCATCRAPTGYVAPATIAQRTAYYVGGRVDPYAGTVTNRLTGAAAPATAPAPQIRRGVAPGATHDLPGVDIDAPYGEIHAEAFVRLRRATARRDGGTAHVLEELGVRDQVSVLQQAAGISIAPLTAIDNSRMALQAYAHRLGERGQAAYEAVEHRIHSAYLTPLCEKRIQIHADYRVTENNNRYVTPAMTPLRAQINGAGVMVPPGFYQVGAYSALVDGGLSQHEVLARQRRVGYKYAVELGAALRGAVMLEWGGRPDIVENMPTRNHGTGTFGGKPWRYVCPLMMPEDNARAADIEPYVESGKACRCRYPEIGKHVGCDVCGVNALWASDGTKPLHVLMHTAYYFSKDMLARMCQDSYGVLVFTHVFRKFEGKMAYRRGTPTPIVEGSWMRLADTVTMTVKGNEYAYEHQSMNWLVDESSYDAGVDGCMSWSKVATIGDFSVDCDPMEYIESGLHVYHLIRCARDEVPKKKRGKSGFLTSLSGTVERELNGSRFTYTRQGDELQIVCRGAFVQPREHQVATMSWAAFEKVACIAPGQEPGLTQRPMRSRAQLHLSFADTAMVLLAIDAYGREELERFSLHRLADLGNVMRISSRFAGRPPPVNCAAALVTGVAVYARTRIPLLAAIAGYCAHRVAGEIGECRMVGIQAYALSRNISNTQIATAGVLLLYLVQYGFNVLIARLTGEAKAKAQSAASILSALASWLTHGGEFSDMVCQRLHAVASRMYGADRVDAFIRCKRAAEEVVDYVRGQTARAYESLPVFGIESGVMGASLGLCSGKQPARTRVVDGQDIQRRFLIACARYALEKACPTHAQIITSLGAAACPVEGLSRGNLSAELNNITCEEYVKERLDWCVDFIWALRNGRRSRAPRGMGHVIFALSEWVMKIAVLRLDFKGACFAALPAMMHIAIRGQSRTRREMYHTFWNLLFLPVVVQGRMRVGLSEQGKLVHDLGMGVFTALRAGNYLVGQGFDELDIPWERKEQRVDSRVKEPNEKRDRTPKAKPLMVVAPLPHDPEFPFMRAMAWTLDNERRSVYNRIVMAVPTVDREYFDTVFTTRYFEMMEAIFEDDKVIEMSVTDWLRTFKRSRRAELLEAFTEFWTDAWVAVPYKLDGRTFSRLKKQCFLKAEQTKSDSDPRAIQASNASILVPGGPWFASLSRLLGEIGDGSRRYRGIRVMFGVGRTKAESFTMFFQYVSDGDPVVMVTGDDLMVFDGFRLYSIDAKRWDAHCRRELLTLGNRLWRKLGARQLIVDLCEAALKRVGRTTLGIEYEVDGNVASGDGDTLAKNCVSNAPIAVVALLECEDPGGALVDGVAPYARSLHEVARKCAIAYEFISEAGVESGDFDQYHDVEFCSAIPVFAADGSVVAAPKIGRVIARFGLCTPGHPADVMLRSKALSLSAESAHSTVLTYWSERAYKHAGPGRLAELNENDLGRRRYTERMTDAPEKGIDLDAEERMLMQRYGARRQQFLDAVRRVWDAFDAAGTIEFSDPLLIAAVKRDN